jgi:hypothetical protein
MIVRFEPDPDLLVRHDGVSLVKRATGAASGMLCPWLILLVHFPRCTLLKLAAAMWGFILKSWAAR